MPEVRPYQDIFKWVANSNLSVSQLWEGFLSSSKLLIWGFFRPNDLCFQHLFHSSPWCFTLLPFLQSCSWDLSSCTFYSFPSLQWFNSLGASWSGCPSPWFQRHSKAFGSWVSPFHSFHCTSSSLGLWSPSFVGRVAPHTTEPESFWKLASRYPLNSCCRC